MTAHRSLQGWVEEFAALALPERIEWCDGSTEAYERLSQLLVANKTLTKLSDA
jgi:phosphoenolpyruvate carboxykinase (GTP)